MSEPLRWEQVRAELLSDPEAAAEYEALGPQYELISQIIDARISQGITQAQLQPLLGADEPGSPGPGHETAHRAPSSAGDHLNPFGLV